MMKNKFAIGCLGVVAVAFLVLIVSAIMIWNQRGEAINLETKIEAQVQSNKSNYDSMWKRFTEMTQVTELQAKQFKDVYTDLIAGRNNDTGLLFKAVREQNPQLNGDVYTKLQNEISSARIQFDNNQKKVADLVAEYNRLVQHRGIIMALITGRDKMDAEKFMVTSDKTTKAFESGKDDAIKLDGSK